VSRQVLDELKQQISLLDYLETHDWRPGRRLSGGRLLGLCPLHADQQPSFLVDPNKNLFYCYGCGRGGNVIRFAELYHQVRFPQALALLQQWRGLPPLLRAATDFSPYISHEWPADSLRFAAIHFRTSSRDSFMRLYEPRWTTTAASPGGVLGRVRLAGTFNLCAYLDTEVAHYRRARLSRVVVGKMLWPLVHTLGWLRMKGQTLPQGRPRPPRPAGPRAAPRPTCKGEPFVR